MTPTTGADVYSGSVKVRYEGVGLNMWAAARSHGAVHSERLWQRRRSVVDARPADAAVEGRQPRG